MTKFASIRSRWLNYSMEILLVLLITVWLYAPFDVNVFVPTLIVMIGGGILYELLFPRIVLTTGKMIFTIPVLWLIGYFSGLDQDLFYLAVLGSVTALRFSKHYADPDREQEFPVFLTTIIGAMIFYFLYNTNDQLVYVLWITLGQICLFVFLRVHRMMVKQPSNPKLQRLLIYLLSAFFAVSVIIALFLPWIKATAFFVLKLISAVFAGIVFLPLNAFFTWFAGVFEPAEVQEEGDESDGVVEVRPEELEFTNEMEPSDLFLNVLLLIGIILLVWFGYKYFKNKIKLMEYSTVSATMQSRKAGGENGEFSFGFRRNKPPENTIRKQLYKLEKRMAKYTFGRFAHESVSEWMDRIRAPKELQVEIDRIYKRVRYGDEDVQDDEAEAYRNSISKMQTWAKEKYRSTKKDIE